MNETHPLLLRRRLMPPKPPPPLRFLRCTGTTFTRGTLKLARTLIDQATINAYASL